MVSIICATLLLLPYTNVFSEKGTWVIGPFYCGEFLASCDKSKLHVDCQAQTFWAMGWISGMSEGLGGIPLQDFNGNSIKYSLIKYCKENPLKNTYDGAYHIYLELTK